MNYIDNKINLEKKFEIASKFIDNLENKERILKGFNIGTKINLHYYLNNWFLFKIEFVGNDAIKIDFKRRKVPNKENKSKEFQAVVHEIVKNSNFKNNRHFLEESIFLKDVNKDYFLLLNQAIEKFYEKVKVLFEVKSAKAFNVVNEILDEKFQHMNQKFLNIRIASGIHDSYFIINREERNLCAILFHILLIGDNLSKFLKKIKYQFPLVDSQKAIYLEYAFIRDIWESIRKRFGINEGNRIKKKIILDFLNTTNNNELEKMSFLEFNSIFVSNSRKPSSNEIESPGNWSVVEIDKHFPDNVEFLKICKFKWSFNAKPDLVIHTTNNHAICIEGKFESGEGYYPSNKEEKVIFKRRNLNSVGQLSIQPKIMEMLGIEAKYILLANVLINSVTHDFYTWKEVFDELDTSSCPNFIREWLKRSDIN